MSDLANYIRTASQVELQEFQLMRLSEAQNLKKQISDLLDECIEAQVMARLARLVEDFKGH